MYKYILILIIAALSIKANAQLSVGVRQGFGVHGIYLEPPSLEQFQKNYFRSNTGMIISYANTNNAGIQVELNYAQKGWQEIDDTIPGSYFKRNINYFEIPILTHWAIGKKAVKPILLAGPYLAFKINESIDSTGMSRLYEKNLTFDHYSQDIRSVDFGIKVGLGIKYYVNKHLALYVEGRYDLDMAGGRDIFKDQPNGIQASRSKEISGSFGIVWHLIPQKEKESKGGYIPKEDLYD